MKKLHLLKSRPSLLSVIMAAAMVFLAAVLIAGAVSQFSQGQWFSGCVSVLGVILVIVSYVLLMMDLSRKKKQEGKENG